MPTKKKPRCTVRTPQERYELDAEFRSLVDNLTHFIIECRFSPSELREAVVLAAIRYETIHARPVYIRTGDTINRIDSYHGKQCACNTPTRFGRCPVHEGREPCP